MKLNNYDEIKILPWQQELIDWIVSCNPSKNEILDYVEGDLPMKSLKDIIVIELEKDFDDFYNSDMCNRDSLKNYFVKTVINEKKKSFEHGYREQWRDNYIKFFT